MKKRLSSKALPAIALVSFFFVGCQEEKKADVSFYYWRSQIALSEKEQEIMDSNHVSELYVRYFDIKLDEANRPKPEASILGNLSRQKELDIVPVVYIKNNVFEKSSSSELNALPENTISLIHQINTHFEVIPKEIQFDCDWTPTTREKFFSFLKRCKALYPVLLSATIRLHQLKYPIQTGTPPVDKGVLMYYNMGEIAADTLSSVYERHTARQYLSGVKPYRLPLDVALPIFSWGVRIQNNTVYQLISKLNASELNGNKHFEKIDRTRFLTVTPCFLRGSYFRQGDIIKIESIGEEQLLEMATDLKNSLKSTVGKVIFFDLDTLNTNKYDSEIFKKVATSLR
jgi:hypothetical protein